jgi:hypothetical protein
MDDKKIVGRYVRNSLKDKADEEENEKLVNDDSEREKGVPEEEETDEIDYDEDNEHLEVEEQGSEED